MRSQQTPWLLCVVGMMSFAACFQGAPPINLDLSLDKTNGNVDQGVDGSQSDIDGGNLECTNGGGETKPQCCASGCGESIKPTQYANCEGGYWSCTSVTLGGTPENLCASYGSAGTPGKACEGPAYCGKTELDKSEPDPVPELCCVNNCNSSEVVRRVCTKSTAVTQKYVCPSTATPLSECPDARNACGGALNQYRANGYKLP
jgi:hypothetical protein